MGLLDWLKSSPFGGRIERTIGQVSSGEGRFGGTLKVHSLRQDRDTPLQFAVGLELVHTTPLSYQMQPITLPRRAAEDLVRLLNEALAQPRGSIERDGESQVR